MQCKVIAISNQKGGCAKSTSTINLGAALVEQGKKVLLIDTDQQANTTEGLGYDADALDYTLTNVLRTLCMGQSEDRDKGIIHTAEGMDLMPADIMLAGIEMQMISLPGREFFLRRYVEPLKEKYDYILIDCPPSIGTITMNAWAAADSIMIPCQAHFFSMKGMSQLMANIEVMQNVLNPGLKLDGILLTMVQKTTRLSKSVCKDVRELYAERYPIFDVEIPYSTKVGISNGLGKSILSYDKKCSVSVAYRKLAEEVLANGR